MGTSRFLFVLFFVSCVFVLHGQSYYFRSYGVREGMSGNAVMSILQDRKGFMWFGTRNGLNRFDGTSFKVFRNNIFDSSSIGSNSIGCLFEDKSGRLWVGTHRGVYIYDARKEVFSPFRKLPPIDIRSIQQDNSNNIWIIGGYELYRYNTKLDVLEHYAFGDELTTTIRLSSKGELWIGTSTGKIKKYNATTNNFSQYRVISPLPKQKKIDNMRDLYPVSDSTLLVGVMNQVLLININSLKVENVFKSYPWANDIKVRTIFRQSDSIYWIGSETGLYTYNIKTRQGNRIQKEPDNPYSITDNVICSISKDSENGIWIGIVMANYFFSS